MDFGKDVTITGYWWIPEKDEKYYGELIYKQNNTLSLNISGAFNGVSDLMEHSRQNLPVIYGIDKNRNCYTLLNVTGETFGSMEFYQSQFEIEIILKSHQRYYFDTEKLRIKEIRFSTNFFIPFFHGHYNAPEGPWLQNDLLQFSLQETPNLELASFDLYNLFFYFSYDFRYKDETLKNDFKLDLDIFLCAEFKKEIQLSEVLTEANFIKDFFSFFCYRQVSFKNFILLIEDETSLSNTNIFFNTLFKERSSQIGQPVRIDHVLLPYTQFGDEQLRSLFRNWMDNRDFALHGLSLYMAIVYLRLSLPVHAFLNIVFAIETFLNTYIPSNKILRERLVDLVESNKNLLTDHISDIEDFCKKVVRQRNFLAHDHNSPLPEITNKEYAYYISVLKMLFEIAFLKKLGLNESSIRFLISKNFMYDYFKIKK